MLRRLFLPVGVFGDRMLRKNLMLRLGGYNRGFSVVWLEGCWLTRCFVGDLPSLKLTASSPLKIGLDPNRKVVFQPSIFRGYVSFREGSLIMSHVFLFATIYIFRCLDVSQLAVFIGWRGYICFFFCRYLNHSFNVCYGKK